MPSCPNCKTPTESPYCPNCGSQLPDSADLPTELIDSTSAPSSPTDGRFTAGTMLAGRYRIVGKLGHGGMGEVYRADDLTLGQSVALKFLSENFVGDARRMEAFLSEVRIARQVTHTNVCSVYDIQDVDGLRFISMEYVDGEDLGSLLRRIGRYSKDKAVEIARQICAGLAAAHEGGVLHRDLKPANIMIDGRGRVRITDFGLAALAGQVAADQVTSGTPAYMAPEQLLGKEVTRRSDIYALGLVLYELFTGRQAHPAKNREELLRSHSSGDVTSPSSHVDDMDPVAERIILKCLEKDPSDRPESALLVAAALPGGDPLAAALAAGETPSPEMVARAGAEGALPLKWAWGLLVVACVLCVALAIVVGRSQLLHFVDLPLPAAALEVRAADLIREFGHEAPVGDTASDFQAGFGVVRWLRDNDSEGAGFEALRTLYPPPMTYWYRQSPGSLVGWPNFSSVRYDNPPQDSQGMARVRLAPGGRLLGFEAVPPAFDDSAGPWPAPDWERLFEAAGLDFAAFAGVPPAWAPQMASDVQAAWEGFAAERADLALRVEAAAYRGKPVSFKVLGPWVEPPKMQALDRGLVGWLTSNLGLAVMGIGSLLVGAIFARKNVRAGRSDTKGGFRLAFWFFVLHTVVWALWASHVFDLDREWAIIQADVGYNLFLAANLWLVYVGLEPYVRKHWPEAIITWSRLLRGKFRDPRFGRDILVGGLLAGVFGLLSKADEWFAWIIGGTAPSPRSPDVNWLGSITGALGFTLDKPIHALLQVMQGVFILLLLRIVLKRIWIAGILFALLVGSMNGALTSDNPVFAWVQTVVMTSVVLVVIVRFGLVATTIGFSINDLLSGMGLSGDLTVWYAPSFLIPFVAVLALLAYGFHISLAGQPMFGSGQLAGE